ncbi:nucleoid-structuring protein H-NS [Marivirga sp. S37H4]|uniref:Nucleoid-structuring protein H-NS n=1 Tax=Marivirga aurantiaca TaxID=2802615 RepID=A0A935C6A9_9BACT|nr:nucleoid-structuring protein H-NS [Marivirga aurantiaca]MBK6264264.1 nucleoid-structuring protein H-NS [Marivirga aurantiaca]
MKSFLRLATLCLLLSAGLFACKSSKKAADQSPTPAPVPEVTEEEMPESEEPVEEAETKANLMLRLNSYFSAISSSSQNPTAANRNINEAKAMFASGDVPVLIIIHESADGTKDYDEPTTIKDYMNYLKDQGKNLNEIYEMKTNANGKITELELIRK